MDLSALSPTQQALLPTEKDIASYEEHGFWISPPIIPLDLLDAAEHGMQRFYDGERDDELPGPVGGWTGADRDVLRKNDYVSLRIHELRDLVAYPMIAATAAVLSGSERIRLWHDQLLYKPVDGPGVRGNAGWHTDRQYWMTCTSEQMLTAWVGFHDVDETCGSISFLDGSHLWDVEGLDFFSQDLAGLEAKAATQGLPIVKRPTTMRRGQVSFHHCRMVHGSGPNRSHQPRRSIAIHLQPGDNRWQRRVLGDGSVARHSNDLLVRTAAGMPDYSDPRICPQLWPRGEV